MPLSREPAKDGDMSASSAALRRMCERTRTDSAACVDSVSE